MCMYTQMHAHTFLPLEENTRNLTEVAIDLRGLFLGVEHVEEVSRTPRGSSLYCLNFYDLVLKNSHGIVMSLFLPFGVIYFWL